MATINNRRECLVFSFLHPIGRPIRYFGTVGFDAHGAPYDIFLQGGKAGSEVESVSRDAAILASKALECGVTIDDLRAAMTRLEDGTPAGPMGVLFDMFAATKELK